MIDWKMIIRRFTHAQHAIDATNLLQLGMKSWYEIIHNTLTMGWILGILFLIFSLIARMWVTGSTSKLVVSNSTIESLWLLIPGFILVSLSLPTLLRLYQTDQQHLFNKISLKTIGMQWYWSYEYNDGLLPRESGRFERYIDTVNNDRLNYLSRGRELYLPRNTEIINIISASDVIHCWAVPNIVLKVDAIPGRVNTISILYEGLDGFIKMYGQCSELCGANHSFIPISIVIY